MEVDLANRRTPPTHRELLGVRGRRGAVAPVRGKRVPMLGVDDRRQPLATRPAPIPHPGPARGAEGPLPAGVMNRHPSPTTAADDESGQQ